MKIRSRKLKAAFTLVEMMIAMAILIIAMALAMRGFMYLWSRVSIAMKQDELDIEAQIAMEQLRRNMRLTTLDKMRFFPEAAVTHTAISFPMARDDDGDGAIDLDADGNIIWDRTLIYHVFAGAPAQLRLTTFDPRDETLTPEERQEQIDSVVTVGNGSATHNSANTSTKVVFANLFDWSVAPLSATYDGYAAALSRDSNVSLGSAVVTAGTHTVTFTVITNNIASSSYNIGVDSLFMSPSYSTREGEAQLPVASESGATAATAYMSGGSWSGNYQLSFPADGVGDTFSLTLNNDQWEETNFGMLGEVHESTMIEFDTDLSPYDFVVELQGNQTNWYATGQSGDASGASGASDLVNGCAIRVLLRGGDMEFGNWISSGGAKCKIAFQAGSSGSLGIRDAFIGECAAAESNSVDAVFGTMTRLTFGGSDSISIGAGTAAESDLVDLEIDKNKSYIVSYLVSGGLGNGNVHTWSDARTNGIASTWLIPKSSGPGEWETRQSTWSSRGDLQDSTSIYGVKYLFTTYPTNGIYTSGIFDTQLSTPTYGNITWSEVVPSDSDIRIKVRTSANDDMSGATAWSALTGMSSPGFVFANSERYVQFQAELEADTTVQLTPQLLNVTIDWTGEDRLVDIGGTFTKGPSYGVFEVTLDGQPLKKGVLVDLSIYDFVRAHGGSNIITSELSAEVTPRNTGR